MIPFVISFFKDKYQRFALPVIGQGWEKFWIFVNRKEVVQHPAKFIL